MDRELTIHSILLPDIRSGLRPYSLHRYREEEALWDTDSVGSWKQIIPIMLESRHSSASFPAVVLLKYLRLYLSNSSKKDTGRNERKVERQRERERERGMRRERDKEREREREREKRDRRQAMCTLPTNWKLSCTS